MTDMEGIFKKYHKWSLCATQWKISLKTRYNSRLPSKMHVSKTDSIRETKLKQNNFLGRNKEKNENTGPGGFIGEFYQIS